MYISPKLPDWPQSPHELYIFKNTSYYPDITNMARQPRPRPNLHAHYHAVSRRADRLSKLIPAKKGVVEVRDQAHFGSHTAQAILVKGGKDMDMPEDFTGCGQCADSDPTAKRPGTWCLSAESCSLCKEDAAPVLMMQAFKRETIVCDSVDPLMMQAFKRETIVCDSADPLMMQAFKRETIVCDSADPLMMQAFKRERIVCDSPGPLKISRSAGGKKTSRSAGGKKTL
jgi:hypothetical protein